MKLAKFSITNYRSITKAHKISFQDMTVLIGKNNEGKSNILKGLNVAMYSLGHNEAIRRRREYGLPMTSYYRRDNESIYNWERDFPISLQQRKSGRQTIFILDFLLDENDCSNFKSNIGSRINGELSIQIKIGSDNKPILSIKDKRGKGSTSLHKKIDKICLFIINNISFNYIPTIRTDDSILRVVHSMLSQYLEPLEKNDEYLKALSKIKELQRPILDKVGNQLKSSLQEFLPNVKSVEVSIYENMRRRALRDDFSVIIDDGTSTELAFKGDGVKNLAALSLLKNRFKEEGSSIIAIEEPESHLHSGAIHQLYQTINSFSQNYQIILTTHSPIFVNRDNLKSNIIVDSGKAGSCKNIGQIREILGVLASDNLVNANYVLVVEGEEDVIALSSILSFMDERISKAIKEKRLIIDSLNGANNLNYKLTLLRNSLCKFYCFLDNDKAGNTAIRTALDKNTLSDNSYTLSKCQGFSESEFEDLINKEIYKDILEKEFGISIDNSKFRGNKKWSERMKNIAESQGKSYDDKLESKIKYRIAECIRHNPAKAIETHHKQIFQTLVDAIIRNFNL